MNDAFIVLVSFLVGCILTYFVMRKSVGEQRWRNGYLHGFNYAWDEKTKADEKVAKDHIKKLRKTGPKLLVIKGDKQ